MDILRILPENVEQLSQTGTAADTAVLQHTLDSLVAEDSDEGLDLLAGGDYSSDEPSHAQLQQLEAELDQEPEQFEMSEEEYERQLAQAIEDDDLIKIYILQSGNTPFLNLEEQIAAAKRIEQGRLALAQEAQSPEILSLIQDGEEARKLLIASNYRLVFSLAQKFAPNTDVPLGDLIQEGNIGLLQSADKYDYRLGFRFGTYATWNIRQKIGRASLDQSSGNHMTIHIKEKKRVLRRARRLLAIELQREPTLEETSKKSNISVKMIKKLDSINPSMIELQSQVTNNGDEEELGEFIEDDRAIDPAEDTNRVLTREKLEDFLLQLKRPRDAKVLRMRFGWDTGEEMTLEEVAQKFGLTRERIRQIEIRGKEEMAKLAKAARLE